MDRIAFLDAPAGIAGDMVLAALIHAGADLAAVRDAVARVAGRPVRLDVRPHEAGAIRGLHLDVEPPAADELERHAGEILDAIAAAGLPVPVADRASLVFRALAAAEGEVHGVPPDRVHFHEVGAIDSIADVVGVAAALHSLGIDRVAASPLPWTRGHVRARHGLLPVPAPATAVLLRGWPVVGVDVEGEFVTPTGAALCAALAGTGGVPPSMRLQAVGYGFGTKSWPDGRPNCVRVLIGQADPVAPAPEWEIAANVDDMTPDDTAGLQEALLAAGALDAWVQPILMKKGRPAWMISAIATADRRDAIVDAFFRESTTIGVRMHPLDRAKLSYEVRTVETPLGPVRVKEAGRDGVVLTRTPESDDLRRIARERGLPLREVRERVRRSI